jgi:hypothetical protein
MAWCAGSLVFISKIYKAGMDPQKWAEHPSHHQRQETFRQGVVGEAKRFCNAVESFVSLPFKF